MLKSMLALTLFVISSSVVAKSIDWTPYLKGMQDSCDLQDIYKDGIIETPIDSDNDGVIDYVDGDNDLMKLLGMPEGEKGKKSNMPKALQPSVSKYHSKEGGWGVDIHLKNAMAFGQPINRINLSYEAGTNLKVYFNNTNFSKLKPQFTLDVDGNKYPVGSNKAWEMTAHENPHTNTFTPTYKSITSAQAKALSQNNTDVYERGLIIINKNGWSEEWYVGGSGLTFDVKNKHISCWSWAD